MSKHSSEKTPAAQPSGSSKKRRIAPQPTRRSSIAVLGLVGLAAAALAFVVLRPLLFPNYWTAGDLGPVRTNSGSPPGPTPEGMVWVPGGRFWMGSE